MPQGKGSQMHNRREYKKYGMSVPDNVDISKTSENIILVDRDIRQAYREIFGEALEQYNSKQNRADRKIRDYCDHIQKSKNGEKLFYEDVVQWGSRDDFQNSQTRERAKEALVKYVNGFEERNQNLKLVGAYIHMDEASPHLHLDYIPVAYGYSRGLETRNSLDKAMKQMGFQPEKESRKNNSTKLWKENERAVFGQICRGMGLEVEAERKARGSLSVEEYKEARDQMLGEVEQEYTEMKAQVERLDEIAIYITTEGQKTVKAENYTIEAKKSIFGQIKEPERAGVFVENMDKGQVEALMQRVKADNRIEDALERTQQERRYLIATAKAEAEGIKAEATAERNKTIAEAESIISEKDSILARARAWADGLKRQYKELVGKVQELLGQKNALETEIKDLQDKSKLLEPLKQEVEELNKAKQILSGELDNEITKSRFMTINEIESDWRRRHDTLFYLRDTGKLVALYKDGSQRPVGRNENNGLDHRTLNDQKEGLCCLGAFVEEERVRVPQKILSELIQNQDRTKPISQNLQNFIRQQTEVKKVITRRKDMER